MIKKAIEFVNETHRKKFNPLPELWFPGACFSPIVLGVMKHLTLRVKMEGTMSLTI